MITILGRLAMIRLLAGWLALAAGSAHACTTVLVGKAATVDGSVLMATSCDGDIMGVIYIMPAHDYGQPAKLPMYWNLPRPKNLAEYAANLRKGYEHVGDLTVSKTYRTIILGGNIESMTTGGLNEHGLSIAIEYVPMRPGLACKRGIVGPNSNHWTTSLIANGLMRARTAREAVRLIGAMVEQYGFQYYRAPSAGVALPIADPRETWLMEIMRDGYQETEFDVVKHPAFNPKGKRSPLARPWGPAELFELVGVRPERAICTPSSGYVFIAELRERLPPPIGNCLWFACGPAYTSCFVPVYAGVTVLPDAWRQPANFARIDRNQTQWNFRLAYSLANNLRYQDAVRDIEQVIEPAEDRFLSAQPRLERLATDAFRTRGAAAAEQLVTEYSTHCLKQVGYAYHQLVDYLMYRYLVGHPEIAPPVLPVIEAPIIPEGEK